MWVILLRFSFVQGLSSGMMGEELRFRNVGSKSRDRHFLYTILSTLSSFTPAILHYYTSFVFLHLHSFFLSNGIWFHSRSHTESIWNWDLGLEAALMSLKVKHVPEAKAVPWKVVGIPNLSHWTFSRAKTEAWFPVSLVCYNACHLWASLCVKYEP